MRSMVIKLQSLSIILITVLCGCIAKNEAASAVVPTATSVPAIVISSATPKSTSIIASVIFTPTLVSPQPTLPFAFLEEIPEGRILYVHIEDYYDHCVEGHCDCSPFVGEGEPPVSPILEKNSKFILNSNFLPSGITEWSTLRKETELVALYTNYSPQHADLQYYSSFPMKTIIGGFTIIGVNSDGDIQAKVQDKYVIIKAGSDYTAVQSEIIDAKCTFLHNYALFNYGFISDDDVTIEDF